MLGLQDASTVALSSTFWSRRLVTRRHAKRWRPYRLEIPNTSRQRRSLMIQDPSPRGKELPGLVFKYLRNWDMTPEKQILVYMYVYSSLKTSSSLRKPSPHLRIITSAYSNLPPLTASTLRRVASRRPLPPLNEASRAWPVKAWPPMWRQPMPGPLIGI